MRARLQNVPPAGYLILGIGFAIWGLKCLYDWHSNSAKKAADPEPVQHISPAQQRVRDEFQVDPGQDMAKAIIWFVAAALLIGFYFVIS